MMKKRRIPWILLALSALPLTAAVQPVPPPPADPETMDRAVSTDAIDRMREIVRRRLPALADAPLLESRVCQYENTSNGHLLLDRLPGHDRVWVAGGGSGHGFKHGPMVGRYMADVIEGRSEADPVFHLAGRPVRARAVF